MKNIKIIPIMLILLLAVTGCSGKYEINENSGQEEAVSFKDYNYDNNKAQLQCVASAAISENGYYLVINGMLYYYDIGMDICSPCCYDSSCSHSGEKCAAYLRDATYIYTDFGKVEECYGDEVFYYDGKIYTVENNKHEEYYLNQYNPQFGDKTRVAVIAENKSEDITTYLRNSQAFKIRDGYLYYVSYSFNIENVKQTNLVKYNCMRVKLAKDSEPEKLGEFEALPCGASFGKPDGFEILFDDDSVYYIQGCEVSVYIDASEYTIAKYDPDSGDFEVIFEYSGDDGTGAFGSGIPAPNGIDDDCCMDGDSNLYFISQKGKQIIQYSVSNKTGKCLYSSEDTIDSIIMDGEYFFITEHAVSEGTARIAVLNRAGDIIQSIDLEYDEDYVKLLESRNKDMTNTNHIVSIMCADDRYIVLTTKDSGLKELSGVEGSMIGIPTVGTAVVKKSDILDGKITDIKQIYKAK